MAPDRKRRKRVEANGRGASSSAAKLFGFFEEEEEETKPALPAFGGIGDDDDDDDNEIGTNAEGANDDKGDEDEVDPLDAFMAAEVMPEVDRLKKEDEEKAPEADAMETDEGEKGAGRAEAGAAESSHRQDARSGSGKPRKQKAKRRAPSYYDSESSDLSEFQESEDDEEWAKNVISGKGSKLEKLIIVDHSKIDYASFRKNFFIESPEIAKMTAQEVAQHRRDLGNIKVRGKDVPKPIKDWHQCGLSSRILQVIKELAFDKPMPIQAQSLPIIMQGRDCIGIAKTGSGKTMAFVLPMLRHVKDQPPLRQGDGPIGLIMAPTRELVQQIGKDVKKFARQTGLRLVCVYGGSGVSDQISALKRGAEIVVCTPGRMIDVLALGSARITNMRRVTYLVLDEADRMFDMGFEPQIKRILNMIRPDRQTVMFSATFPKQVEMLARTALTSPVEILAGGRSVVNTDIEQIVEVRPEEQRFLRLLELLGHWYERGKVLIFVASQDKCDNLFRDLLRCGYPCMSLHGGKDQSDRESTITDFKSDVCNVLVATSVAARGLDVRDLHLVVNYDVPNHHEDYVHRVGRTGRAGNKGTAVTFIAPDEEKFAPDLVKALKESGKEVPYALQEMADDFGKKRDQGLVQARGSGFGGSGFKFDEEEEDRKKQARKMLMAARGEGIKSDEEDGGKAKAEDEIDDDDDDIKVIEANTSGSQKKAQAPKANAPGPSQAPAQADHAKGSQAKAGAAAKAPGGKAKAGEGDARRAARRSAFLAAAHRVAAQLLAEVEAAAATDPAARAAAIAARLSGAQGPAPPSAAQQPPAENAKHFSTEIEINDFPQKARWKVTHRDSVFRMSEEYNVSITAKGVYVAPGRQAQNGDRKLYLLIEGPTERGVKLCKQEIKKMIKEATERTLMSGRYQV